MERVSIYRHHTAGTLHWATVVGTPKKMWPHLECFFSVRISSQDRFEIPVVSAWYIPDFLMLAPETFCAEGRLDLFSSYLS